MSWEKAVVHICDRPEATQERCGQRWTCDACGAQLIVERFQVEKLKPHWWSAIEYEDAYRWRWEKLGKDLNKWVETE